MREDLKPKKTDPDPLAEALYRVYQLYLWSQELKLIQARLTPKAR